MSLYSFMLKLVADEHLGGGKCYIRTVTLVLPCKNWCCMTRPCAQQPLKIVKKLFLFVC